MKLSDKTNVSAIGRCVLAGALVLLVGACSDDDNTAPDANVALDRGAGEAGLDAGPDQSPPDAALPDWSAPFEPAACGAAKHVWLPPATMGRVLSKERSSLYSLPVDALKAIVQATDYKNVVNLKYDVEVYFVRYETQDRGKKVEATMALGFPRPKTGTTLKAPTVMWTHGTSGFTDACAPTAKGADAALPVALMAALGYVAVAPDYIGMNGFGAKSTTFHAYLGAEATAIASWDSVRAGLKVLAGESTAVSADGQVIPWGGSQGGHAALAAVLYGPYYAAEYSIPAAVALIPPADLVTQAQIGLSAFSDTTMALAAAITALARWYGQESKLSEVLTDAAPNNFASTLAKNMDSECRFDKTYSATKVSEIYTAGLIDAAAVKKTWKGYETWRCLLAENSITRSSVKAKVFPPTLFVVSEKDTLVQPASQRPAFDTLCQQGHKLEYIECKDAKHTEGAVWSLPEQFAWVEDRLAGKPLANPCKRSAAVCCKGTTKGPCAGN